MLRTVVKGNMTEDSAYTPRIILYDEAKFHCSINGRNGFRQNDIYHTDMNGANKLGAGTFGVVYRALHNYQADTWVAIKRTKPTKADLYAGPMPTYDDVELRSQEIKALTRLRGEPYDDHIMQLHEFFWNGTDLYLVLELLPADLRDGPPKNLRQAIVDLPEFSEEQAKEAARSILSGLKALEQHHIVHRDIKESNVLFGIANDFSTLKICDFGLAKDLSRISHTAPTRTICATSRMFCGTFGYIAPEMYLGSSYGCEVDMFSFGVLLFRILSGKLPWKAEDCKETYVATCELKYSMDDKHWRKVSHNAKRLVKQLLVRPNERPMARKALTHSWFGEQSHTILSSYPSSHFKSDSSCGPDVARVEEVVRYDSYGNGTYYWIHEKMRDAVSRLVAAKSFHGHIKDSNGDFMLIQEKSIGGRYTLLPHAILNMSTYTEKVCRDLFRQMLMNVVQFHDAGLAHRFLHPESFVVEQTNGNYEVSIRGIQNAEPTNSGNALTGYSVNPYEWYFYIAPEIDKSLPHDERADLWSLGAMLYTMLCGIGPFQGDKTSICENKARGMVDFQPIEPSHEAQSLIRALLQPDPAKRLSLYGILSHPWMEAPDFELDSVDSTLARNIFEDWNQTES